MNNKSKALVKKMSGSKLRPYTKADFRRDNPIAKDMPKGVNALEKALKGKKI